MTNPRSASNAWAAIKKKILARAGITPGEKADGEEGAAATPKATPRKRAKKADAEGDAEEGGSPKKKARTPRKSKAKSKESAEEEREANGEADGEEGSGSPIKKEVEDEEDVI
jgi:hypothetical protein